jgi:predicted Zn-dependent protease
MVAAGYDARPAPGVFEMLGAVSASGGGERLPGWLSTHPAPENRQSELTRRVAELERDFAGAKRGEQEYLAFIDGMVFGPDPREGFFEGSRFLHPEMAFRLDFPEGWQTRNGREAVVGTSPEEDALVSLTLATATTARGALDEFVGREGIVAESSWRSEIHDHPVASRRFSAATSQGTVRGIVAFVEHGGRVLRLMGYTLDSRWSAYRPALESSLASFDRLTDPDALGVQPARVAVVDATSAMTIEAFAESSGSSATPEQLALLNRLDRRETLQPGRPYKTVRGGRPR